MRKQKNGFILSLILCLITSGFLFYIILSVLKTPRSLQGTGFLKGLQWIQPAEAKNKSKKKQANQKKYFNHPTVKAIHKRRARRIASIEKYKEKKIVGEADNGLLKIRSAKRLNKKQKKKLESVIKKENKDRNKLYRILMKVEKFPADQEAVLRESMFESYLQWDPEGTYFYEKTHWQKK